MAQTAAVHEELPQLLYPLEDVREALGIRHVASVRSLIHAGHLKAVVLPGGAYRVTRAAIDAFIAEHATTGPHKIAIRHPGRNGRPYGRPKGGTRTRSRRAVSR